jgi:MtN3 and saliva related transmembrane protein
MNPFTIGIIAGILTAISMMPQLIKTIREKKAGEISPFMLLLLMSGLAMWVWYGSVRNDWPLIITNSFSFLLNSAMLILRLKYGRQ